MSEEKYNKEWFKKRALGSLKKISEHTWDYSDSLLLYISSGVEKYEQLQEGDTSYFQLVTKPEREYLKSIAKNVVEGLPAYFEYIDLGPGTEHKEQFFFDELKRQNKKFIYIPVDISEEYLALAKENAQKQGIETKPLKAAFEEVAGILGESNIPRFVNIGLTFSNYEPAIIFDLLKNIAGKDGYMFINTQMRDRVDMKMLHDAYVEDAVTLADDKLNLIGLDPLKDVTPREVDDGFRVWCSVINSNKELENVGIQTGDKLLVFQSIRYTLEQLESELLKTGMHYKLFDTGQSFVAVLIRA